MNVGAPILAEDQNRVDKLCSLGVTPEADQRCARAHLPRCPPHDCLFRGRFRGWCGGGAWSGWTVIWEATDIPLCKQRLVLLTCVSMTAFIYVCMWWTCVCTCVG